MTTPTELIEGRCLCGEIHFRVRSPFHQFHLCHCSRCRHATGSAHAANIFADPDAIEWLAGEEFRKRFDLPQAQHFSRSFCSQCGSPVPWLARSGKLLIIPAGSLSTAPAIQPQDHIFWADRADWYDAAIAEDCTRFTGYPDK